MDFAKKFKLIYFKTNLRQSVIIHSIYKLFKKCGLKTSVLQSGVLQFLKIKYTIKHENDVHSIVLFNLKCDYTIIIL